MTRPEEDQRSDRRCFLFFIGQPTSEALRRPRESTQYASRDYRVALDAAGFRCSMSRKGNCWGNEPAESFFSTIKAECLHQQSLQTRPDAHLAIVQYIRCYDATRRHSTIGFISPAKFEASFLPRPAS